MADEPVCPTCGSPLAKNGRCTTCEGTSVWALLRGDIGMLALLVVLLVAFFAFTTVVVHRYQSKLRQLGGEWADEGRRSLQSGQAAVAVTDFQTAQRYGPDVPEYRYGLVNALLAAHRTEQARSYLLNMWEHQPGDGLVNLQLARIAATRNDVTEATRYYHNAIYGAWDEEGTEHRIRARMELVELLMARGDKRHADAELTALAASTPATPELSHKLCILFARADDHDSALKNCEAALKSEPTDRDLLAHAAWASFQLGQYAATRQYLEREHRLGYHDPNESTVGLAELILNSDPLNAQVSYRVRVQRLLAALAQTTTRLEGCPAALTAEAEGTLLRLKAAQTTPSIRQLQRDPDALTATAGLVFSAQAIAADACGPPSDLDRALLLIAKRHEGNAAR